MIFFDGRFDFLDVNSLSANRYKVKGRFIDKTGMYSPLDVRIGDIIYGTDPLVNNHLVRYKITEIHLNEFSGAIISVTVEWDMIPGINIVAPYLGMQGIIGALHDNGVTANITSSFINGADMYLVSKAEAYQTMLLGTITNPVDLEAINKKIVKIEDQISSVQLEWE